MAAVLRGPFQFLQGYLAERTSQIERLGFSYYDRVETEQLVTRLTSDAEQLRTFAGSGNLGWRCCPVLLWSQGKEDRDG